MLKGLVREYRGLTKHEHLFIILAMVCSFFVTIEASITKAVSNSMFLGHYSVSWLPYVWFAVIPVNLAVVSLYNRYLPRVGCFQMFLYSTGLTIGINLFSAYFINRVSWLPFFLYIWKDVYIMLMFQQLWSVIHSTISTTRAKILYGVFYGLGGLGSFAGSFVPGYLAIRYGSEKLLLVTVPLFICLMIAYGLMLRVRSQHPEMESLAFDRKEKSNFSAAFKQILTSKALIFISLLVICMQLASTLLDFKFNAYVSGLYPIQDVRTEYLGRFFGVVNICNVFLQFIGSFLVVHFLGVKKTHFIIPLFLGGCALATLFFPVFSLVAFLYGSIKSIDYSIFGVVKEMLYVPLKKEEKFQAKAVIDVFIYRASKALASLVIIGIQLVAVSFLQSFITGVLCLVFLLWGASVLILYREGEQRTAATSS